MMTVIIILFTIVISIGVYLLFNLFKISRIPVRPAFAHGIIALLSLPVLGIYVAMNPDDAPIGSLFLFILAATIGFSITAIKPERKIITKVMALTHALLALTGFLLLLIHAFL